ncbi:hypothetical protein GGS24DRAFT_160814 [Hypoxylon argillaceum]|nr:hypothetical protein GGS24DRAFT_160814 [Hypoxylon argillaceum]
MGLLDPLTIPHLLISMPWCAKGGKGSLPVVLLAIAPVVLPAAYLAYVLRQGARRTTASASITPPDPLAGTPLSTAREDGAGGGDTLAIPPDVLVALDEYVVARERVVSEAVPLGSILAGLRGAAARRGEADGENQRGARGLLETYLGTTMRAFTWMLQAFVMKAIVSRLPDGAALARTFATPYLDACRFEAGDRVCGVYVVRERVSSSTGERVFLDLSPPEGWSGPVVTGVLDCGFVVEEKGGEKFVRFVNETILWRRRDGKPTLLEGTVSRWLHTAMIAWMMVRGVEAVSDGRAKVKMT